MRWYCASFIPHHGVSSQGLALVDFELRCNLQLRGVSYKHRSPEIYYTPLARFLRHTPLLCSGVISMISRMTLLGKIVEKPYFPIDEASLLVGVVGIRLDVVAVSSGNYRSRYRRTESYPGQRSRGSLRLQRIVLGGEDSAAAASTPHLVASLRSLKPPVAQTTTLSRLVAPR